MNCLHILTIVSCAALAQATLHGGNIQFSGSFQAHPLFANHRFFKGNNNKPAEPVAFDNTIPESTVPIMPVIVEMPPPPPPMASFHSNVDIKKVVNDLVGVKIGLLRFIQSGVADRFDRKVQRLEQFGTHVDNHFSKEKPAASSGPVVSFDANLSVNDGTRIAALPAPVDEPIAPIEQSDSSDFNITDDLLDAHKGEHADDNCDH